MADAEENRKRSGDDEPSSSQPPQKLKTIGVDSNESETIAPSQSAPFLAKHGDVDDDTQKKPFMFQPQQRLPSYKWKLPMESQNPARGDLVFESLLMNDFFIDKSVALFDFLKCWFEAMAGDFQLIPLHLVYPRRFAKTTLLRFIEAVFSPMPQLGSYTLAQVKNKISSLEKGQDLLNFGMHPVVFLNMQRMVDVKQLNRRIGIALRRAGLENYIVDETLTPSDQLVQGVTMLNEQFQAQFNVATKTIVLIDEHDKPFRQRDIKDDSDLLMALVELYSLGKEEDVGISLFILCGLTRMVGTGLSLLNNLVDVSQRSEFHGLCGISTKEIVHSCEEVLCKYCNGQSLESVLENDFIPDWDGFRFGVDKFSSGEGNLDPFSTTGALFSPLDVWQIIQSLSSNRDAPSSKWIATMKSEFEFTNFADVYLNRKNEKLRGFFDLYRNLQGGWVDTEDEEYAMERTDYLTLSTSLHVKKVLFELGLLSVKEIGLPTSKNKNMIRLGSPNMMVTKSAMALLVKETEQLPPTEEMIRVYLKDSAAGFMDIVSSAAMEVSNAYRETGKDVFREYPFQDYLFMELLYRFPKNNRYELSCEKHVSKNINVDDDEHEVDNKIDSTKTNLVKKKPKKGRADIALSLLDGRLTDKAVLIELKVKKIGKYDDAIIENAHNKNIEIASAQVKQYKVDARSIVRVAVSGVWHPALPDTGTYGPDKLSAKCKFLAD